MAGLDYIGTTTYDFMTAESASIPILIDKIPTPDATGVPIASNITLTFNKALQKGVGIIELWADGSVAPFERFDVATSSRLKFVNKQLIIDPTNTLAQGVTYRLAIPDGAIQDLVGNNYALDFEYKFTTLDTIAPTITSFSPSDGATVIATDTNISMMFSESVKFGTGVIQLRTQSATGPVVEAFNTAEDGNATIEGNVLTLDPKIDLKPNTLYFLTLASGAIKDMSGNLHAGIATYDFTTAQDTVSPVVKTFQPADGAMSVALDAGIEINFSEPIVSGVGNIEIRVGSRLGPVIESFNVANSPHLQFVANMLTILPTMELEPQTHYFVTLPRGSVKDVFGNLYLGTSTYDFFTLDNSPPIKIDSTPREGQTNVMIYQSIDLVFNEPIKIGTGDIEIRLGLLPTGPLVKKINITSDKVVIADNMLRVNLNENDFLALNTDYFIRIPAGIVKDEAGNNFQGIKYNFKTTSNSAGTFFNTTNNDVFSGSEIIDTVVYTGQRNDFNIAKVGGTNNWYVNKQGQGDDLLKNIERIWFSDKHLALDVGINQNAGKALLFLNTINPSLTGDRAWLGQIISLFDSGNSMQSTFDWALNTVSALSGPISNEILVQLAYHNLIGVDPDVATMNTLLGFMDGRVANYTQAKFLTVIAELNIKHIELMGLQQTGIEYL